MRQEFAAAARRAERAGATFESYLQGLAERECQTRRASRIERLLRASRLPPDKTLASFELDRLPLPVLRQLSSLREGSSCSGGRTCCCSVAAERARRICCVACRTN